MQVVCLCSYTGSFGDYSEINRVITRFFASAGNVLCQNSYLVWYSCFTGPESRIEFSRQTLNEFQGNMETYPGNVWSEVRIASLEVNRVVTVCC